MPSERSGATASSPKKQKIVVDSVHGDIRPSDLEWEIIDTPSFQRLRKLKQLQMSHLVYPNATHTRFAHSIGVLRVMQRIVEHANVSVSADDAVDLRLAALLHDVGHYPYSHLLEGVDSVILTEEKTDLHGRKSAFDDTTYPSHEEVGKIILQNQPDLLKILGSEDRAKRIGNLFSRSELTDLQLSKLIHSSLDMDRIDYLIRDSQGTGVPYGLIDIDYLLNHIKRSPTGLIGITHKAVAAAEHLLLARSFLFRIVYQHKTTFGFEEAARQLLRRLRNRARSGGNGYGIPKDADEVLDYARSQRLPLFTDDMLDQVFIRASLPEEPDKVIRLLATSIVARRPPRLIWEKRTFSKRSGDGNEGQLFLTRCQLHLEKTANSNGLELGQFLICELPPIGFEKRGHQMTKGEAKRVLEAGEKEEMIRVFPSPDAVEPVDIVDMEHSLLHVLGSQVFRTYRLYVVCPEGPQDERDRLVEKLKRDVKEWQGS